MNLKEIYF